MKRMTSVKRIAGAVFASALAAASTLRADTLAQWTFETSQPAGAASTTSPNVIPETLFNASTGVGSGTHAGAAVWSSPAGNASVHSFSANLWAQNDYWQFTVTPDVNYTYTGINVSYDQNGSATGPKTFYFEYSVNGSSWTSTGFTGLEITP